MPTEQAQIYLTKEQLHRLSGLACDALVGIQMQSDCDGTTDVSGTFVPINAPYEISFFRIEPDGTYHDET